MKQKIIKIGNAHGVIIPKKLLDEVGLKPGSEVIIEKDPENQALSLADKPRTKSSITPDFWNRYERIRKRYDIALKELAKR